MTMRLIIDARELGPVEGGVAQALEQARLYCRSRGRVIVEVRVDDRLLGEPQLASADLGALTGREVACVSEDSWELVDASFAQAAEALDQLALEHHDVACDLDRGERQAAMHRLGEVLQMWSQLRQVVVQGLTLLELDIDTANSVIDDGAMAAPGGQTHIASAAPAAVASVAAGADTGLAQRSINALRDGLEDIRRAIQNDDWVRLSDCLGYTMDPVVTDWQRLLQALRVVIADRRPAVQP